MLCGLGGTTKICWGSAACKTVEVFVGRDADCLRGVSDGADMDPAAAGGWDAEGAMDWSGKVSGYKL
jgi:hypothetical protein